jgi:hypothetical protein
VVDSDDASDPRFRELARVLPGDLNVNAVLGGGWRARSVGRGQFGDLMGGRGEVLLPRSICFG